MIRHRWTVTAIDYAPTEPEKQEAREDMRNNYRVEIVQTNVFYIEAESPDQARDIATIDYVWDENQTGKNWYDIGFNITEEEQD